MHSYNNGTVIKRMGVDCAIRIQESLADHEVIQLRVGIHIGEVVIEDEDIYGDGVNVAARLKALAEPGQVLISDTAHHSLDGKSLEHFSGGKSHQLKNIARQVAVWHWPAKAVVGQVQSGHDDNLGKSKPSLAILPFENLTGDEDYDFFCFGLAEDILTVLSRTNGLDVISSNSSFAFQNKGVGINEIGEELDVQHVLQGSIRKSGARVRVSAKLARVVDKNSVWAENYNRTPDDIFDLQDDITKEIVTALQIKFTSGEIAQIWSRGTQNIDAWRNVVDANELLLRFSQAANLQARELLEIATATDPDYAMAWALLGATYWYEARINPDINVETTISMAENCVSRARTLDYAEPWAAGLAGMIETFRGNHKTAVAIAREGVTINPGSAEARAFYAFCLSFANELQDAIIAFQEVFRLNPLHPIWYLTIMARLYDQNGDFEQAIETSKELLRREENSFTSQIYLASIYGRLDRLDEAREMATKALQNSPNFTVDQAALYLMNIEGPYLGNFEEGLRKAGIPDH